MNTLNAKYAKFVREVRERDPEKFYTIFDGGKSFSAALTIALLVFEKMILPFALKYLGEYLKEKQSLDVGYGSGFQVSSAAKQFGTAWGIDVHQEADTIIRDFTKRGLDEFKNVNLVEGEAANIPMTDNTVDFVHSWVTFLHFPSIEYVKLSLKEIFRVLKPGGVSVIYYPRLVKTKRMETPEEYQLDLKLEDLDETGYSANESLTEPFKKGISIARWKMSELVNSIGFEVLEHTSSNDGGFIFGQHGIVLRKPPIVEPKRMSKPVKRLIQRTKKSTASKKQKS